MRNRPPTRYSTRSTMSSTGLTSWVTNTTAASVSLRCRSISSLTTRWCPRSRLRSGSSQRRSRGSDARAWATRSRCCSPPERVETGASAYEVAPTASSSSSTRARSARRLIGSPQRWPVTPKPTRSRARTGVAAVMSFCCGM
ncbi:hypothetical protein BC477_06675 [Clavibacter michiganensis subsp. michiganensis]|uniref:Uncharacterized protein n=1 Tax=Clavibacter michiganensis subsp. michiganensis TaxID=33013 RepID=A0A251XLP4_CLAMM|nr:hypothetical protein BC477_06675 [Clavibacter michiganensis subsp. michiganensis]OUE04402.1 hypothetical protein CMMCAS07_05605 [Clavibacter michiganensis subsp. michiganensis]